MCSLLVITVCRFQVTPDIKSDVCIEMTYMYPKIRRFILTIKAQYLYDHKLFAFHLSAVKCLLSFKWER